MFEGKSMNKTDDYENIIIVIGIAVIISLLCTCIILSNITRKADKAQREEKTTEVSGTVDSVTTYKNCFVWADKAGNIIFIHDDKRYEVEGKMDKEFEGVADVVVSGNELSEIRAFSDCFDGTLTSYTKTTLLVNDDKKIKYSKDTPVFVIKDDDVKQVKLDKSLFVGYEGYKFVFRNDKLNAIVMDKRVGFTKIGVVIKNNKKLYYKNVKLKDNDGKTVFDSKKAFKNKKVEYVSNNKKIKLNDRYFEGEFVIYKEDKGYVVVNKLDIEKYLKYVVPSEMPASFPEEALKAQAICARTFAYSHMNNKKYAKYGANLDNTTSYQVYDTKVRYDSTDKAVEDTKGKVALHDGKLIVCYYFSTCSNLTQCMDVWQNDSPSYIKQVESKDDNSIFYKWRAVLELKNVTDSEYGKLKQIKIVKKTKGGYVSELDFVYEKGKRTYKGENNIRSILGKYMKTIKLSDDTWKDNMTSIPSACFNLIPAEEGVFVLEGGGFGHGIGMSQYGAGKMARNGKNYKEIISYYYKDVKVSDYK